LGGPSLWGEGPVKKQVLQRESSLPTCLPYLLAEP
jgi:hypothetical protein